MSALPFLSTTWVVKSLQLIGGVLWTVYMVYAGAWGQLPGEVVYFVAWGVSVIKMVLTTRRESSLELFSCYF